MVGDCVKCRVWFGDAGHAHCCAQPGREGGVTQLNFNYDSPVFEVNGCRIMSSSWLSQGEMRRSTTTHNWTDAGTDFELRTYLEAQGTFYFSCYSSSWWQVHLFNHLRQFYHTQSNHRTSAGVVGIQWILFRGMWCPLLADFSAMSPSVLLRFHDVVPSAISIRSMLTAFVHLGHPRIAREICRNPPSSPFEGRQFRSNRILLFNFVVST